MPHYLEASMENFQANQRKLQEMFKQSMGGEAFAKMAETNMAMFKAAANAFMPKPGESGEVSRSTTKGDDELSALRTQMAEMQKKLDSLGK
jgi:polyhydroxyalkanoate synthesis regulator protein